MAPETAMSPLFPASALMAVTAMLLAMIAFLLDWGTKP
jgi:hypothetical protein